MKISRVLYLFSAVILFFAACQPELNPPPTSPADGSLVDSNGDCYTAVVGGIYQESVALTASNYIDAGANFLSAGTYEVSTDTVNGYYFKGNGTILNVGNNTIRLTAYGQPIIEGSDTFHMHMNGSVCEVAVAVISSTTPPADITLGGAGGTCTGAVLAGNYVSGTTVTTANTVTLNVTVNTAGPYNISTNTVNGVSFSGSGMATTATTSIILTATGTSAASATNVTSSYTVTAGTGTCSFDVVFAGVPAGPASFSFDCGTMDPTFPIAGERLRVGQVVDPNVDTITVQVDVVTAGTYSIVTTYGLGGADGVTFNTSGVFTNTGIQTLRLGASGTAGRGGIVFYNISSPQSTNSTPCSTSCYYEFLYCSINGSFQQNFTYLSDVVNDNTTVPGYDLIRWKGYSSGTGTENVELTIGLPTGGDFNTTSTDIIYTANDFPGKYVKAVYTDAGSPSGVYSAETDGTVQANPFTITITFCTSGRIEGNYTGVVKDNGGAGPGQKTISGSFGLWRL